MGKIQTVWLYDRMLSRRLLYAGSLESLAPVTVRHTDSWEEFLAGAAMADLCIASLDDAADRLQKLSTVALKDGIVIDSQPYDAALYGSLDLRGHFVRQQDRLPHIWNSISNILNH